MFKVGQIWAAPAGRAVVISVAPSGLATFRVLTPSQAGAQCGYLTGSTFRAHPDDCCAPSVRESFQLIREAKAVRA